MKVLITGGAGFIGSNIADRFIKDSSEVVIKFYRCDVRSKQIPNIFEKEKQQIVIRNACLQSPKMGECPEVRKLVC